VTITVTPLRRGLRRS